MLRVQPPPVNLHAIGRLDAIAAALGAGRLDRRRALEEIEELGQHPLRHARVAPSNAVTSLAQCRGFGRFTHTGWQDDAGL